MNTAWGKRQVGKFAKRIRYSSAWRWQRLFLSLGVPAYIPYQSPVDWDTMQS